MRGTGRTTRMLGRVLAQPQFAVVLCASEEDCKRIARVALEMADEGAQLVTGRPETLDRRKCGNIGNYERIMFVPYREAHELLRSCWPFQLYVDHFAQQCLVEDVLKERGISTRGTLKDLDETVPQGYNEGWCIRCHERCDYC